nr:cytoplasmic protein [Sphingobium subterraneum]
MLNSSKCGCFYCFKIYESSEIENWVEETQGNFASASDPFTALCPKCGIDAVIGTASGYPVDDVTFLQNMHTKWFE